MRYTSKENNVNMLLFSFEITPPSMWDLLLFWKQQTLPFPLHNSREKHAKLTMALNSNKIRGIFIVWTPIWLKTYTPCVCGSCGSGETSISWFERSAWAFLCRLPKVVFSRLVFFICFLSVYALLNSKPILQIMIYFLQSLTVGS